MRFDVTDPTVVTLWEMLLRLLLAALCGGLIGFERTHRQKEAGLRTHIIVAIASALMMLVSKYAFFDMLPIQSATVDVSRIAANIITGISFLGAGVIFVRQDLIRGLTTAAGIWATTGVGIALGGGMYSVGVAATGLILLVQFLLPKIFRAFDSNTMAEVVLVTEETPDAFARLKEQISSNQVSIHSCAVERTAEGLEFCLSLRIPATYTCDDVMEIWGGRVRSVRISNT